LEDAAVQKEWQKDKEWGGLQASFATPEISIKNEH